MNTTTLLEAKNISKSFPGVKALQNVSFEIKTGEIHVLLGENGAGKSTLLKILSGIYQADEGDILVKQTTVKIENTKIAQKLGITIIHQELNLMPHLNVAENIFIGKEPKNKIGIIDKEKLHTEAKKILLRLKVNINTHTLVSNLTIANQQMVEIAKALSVDSSILIMDEPTAALTDKEITQLFEIIGELKEQGLGIVYISHRMEEIKKLADRVTILRDGEKVKTLMYKDTTVDEMIELMVGREMNSLFPEKKYSIGETFFKVKNLTRKNYFDNISFDLKRGEIFAIAGLAGAGRTEIGRALAGVDNFDSGEIYLNDKLLEIKSIPQAIKDGIMYLSEDRKKDGLFLGLSVSDNILTPNLKLTSNFIGKIYFNKLKEICKKYIQKVNIKTPSPEQKIKLLSGGNQQKAIVARAICRPKNVLIIDEPTRGIDINAKYEIYNLLMDLASNGAGIIMISSELPEVLGFADRVLVVYEGKMTAILENKNLDSPTIMKYATNQTNMFA